MLKAAAYASIFDFGDENTSERNDLICADLQD